MKHYLYIVDRRCEGGLDALARFLAPVGEGWLEANLPGESGRWLILAARIGEAKFFSLDEEAAVLQVLEDALEETGQRTTGEALSVDWRVTPELSKKFGAAISAHVRRYTTDAAGSVQ